MLGSAAAPNAALKRAAELTLAKGYTHFVLADPSNSSGFVSAGASPVFTTAQARTVGGVTYGTATSFGGGPRIAPIANVGVTVIMLRPGDPGFDKALDAHEVLKTL